jgi:hypothetical protein
MWAELETGGERKGGDILGHRAFIDKPVVKDKNYVTLFPSTRRPSIYESIAGSTDQL